jgi:hypothetical protein
MTSLQTPGSTSQNTTSTGKEETKKSIFGKGPGFDKTVAIVTVVLAILSVCIGMAACIIAVSVPEIRHLIGLKDSSPSVEVIIPTEIAQPTATTGPCVDWINVRFVSDPQFFHEPIARLDPTPPGGEYMLLEVEYKNLQSSAISLYWDQVFKIAGQFDTTGTDFTYYAPNQSVSFFYADDHNIVQGCTDNLNPGLWNSCLMVFDIDPALTNLYLVLQDDYGGFTNSCTTYWKVPIEGR